MGSTLAWLKPAYVANGEDEDQKEGHTALSLLDDYLVEDDKTQNAPRVL